jgi:hypothetical protein
MSQADWPSCGLPGHVGLPSPVGFASAWYSNCVPKHRMSEEYLWWLLLWWVIQMTAQALVVRRVPLLIRGIESN